MSRASRFTAATLAALLVSAAFCFAGPVTVTPDRPTGVYSVGDSVRWKIAWRGNGDPSASMRYVLKSGGLKQVGQGELTLTDSAMSLESKFDAPGTMLVEVKWEPASSANRAFGGAVAEPFNIAPAAPPPEDFDAFWKAKLEELAKVPPNPKLTPADGGKNGVRYERITLDNIRGTHVNGQIARPEQGEQLPALLIVQWAGVYPLQKPWVTDRAAEGWLAMNILPHDLPIDEPEPFYKQQFDGPLRNYWAIGNDHRDTSYYLRMYLSCVRAVEYLKSRSDWDRKALVVMGTSQGGQQALATAGLCGDSVTAVLPFLPAACDTLAPDLNRASGFPFWYTQVHGKDPAKVRAASRYYDPVNFARKINCPVLIGAALYDDLAPPSSVLAAANVITSPKEVILLPNAGHQDERGSHKPYNDRASAWLAALRQGRPAPKLADGRDVRFLRINDNFADASGKLREGLTIDGLHFSDRGYQVWADAMRPILVEWLGPTTTTTQPATQQAGAGAPPSAAEQDHRRMLDLLKIDKLRRAADADPSSPFAANSDESKAGSRVDNSACPSINVEIQLALTTPAGPNWPTFLRFAQRYLMATSESLTSPRSGDGP